MAIFIIIIFLIITVLQGKMLVKKREWKEFAVFEILLIIGFVLSLLIALGNNIPDPIEGLKKILDRIYGFF